MSPNSPIVRTCVLNGVALADLYCHSRIVSVKSLVHVLHVQCICVASCDCKSRSGRHSHYCTNFTELKTTFSQTKSVLRFSIYCEIEKQSQEWFQTKLLRVSADSI